MSESEQVKQKIEQLFSTVEYYEQNYNIILQHIIN